MQFWSKTSICQSSMVHKCCWVNCPATVGNLEAPTARESARRVQLSLIEWSIYNNFWHTYYQEHRPLTCFYFNNLPISCTYFTLGTTIQQPGSDRPRSARSSGLCAQSGGQAKKASISSGDFMWNCHSLFNCAQDNSLWSPAQMF